MKKVKQRNVRCLGGEEKQRMLWEEGNGKKKKQQNKKKFKRAPDLSVYLFKFIESKSDGFNV